MVPGALAGRLEAMDLVLRPADTPPPGLLRLLGLPSLRLEGNGLRLEVAADRLDGALLIRHEGTKALRGRASEVHRPRPGGNPIGLIPELTGAAAKVGREGPHRANVPDWERSDYVLDEVHPARQAT